MHFCGSAIFGAVSVLNERHTVVLEVNSAALFLFQDTLKCEYYLVSCALQRLTWTSCLAIWSEIIHVNSQSHAVDLWKNETSNGKRKEIARSRNNLSRKIQMFFLSCHFSPRTPLRVLSGKVRSRELQKKMRTFIQLCIAP